MFLVTDALLLSSPRRRTPFRQLRRTLRRRAAELGLDEDFLDSNLPGIEPAIQLLHLLEAHAMRQHAVWIQRAVLELLQQVLPIQVHRRLAVPNQPDAALHQAADVEVVGEADVDAGDTDAPEALDACDALVQDLRGVSFRAEEQLEVVRPSLGVLACRALEGDVWPAVFHLLERRRDAFALGERAVVDGLDLGQFALNVVEPPRCRAAVNEDDSPRPSHEAHICAHLADGTGAPDGNHVTFLNTGVHYSIP